MSGFNAPLSVQAASLKKSVQNRERRRNARQVGSAPYRTVSGGTSIDTTASVLQAGSAWEAADVEAKALLKSGSSGVALTPESAVYDHAPQVFHCSLCQASTTQAAIVGACADHFSRPLPSQFKSIGGWSAP